ncbi:MAG: LysR family transcriptional regulator [Rhizobiaceae bacterium]|nr:LysR family transcriptional regulator [Rhizobiaceae bacterium]
MKFNPRQLEVFQSVIMVGSATKAAAGLGISQPAVSRMLGDLESAVGFKLLERRGGRLTPTREGTLFHDQVERYFRALESIERVAASIETLHLGELRIAAMQAFANGLVPLAIAAFAERFPNVPVTLDGRPRSWVVEQVAAGEVDVGIGILPVDDAAVETRRLGTLPAMALVPAGDPQFDADVLGPRDLADRAFVTFPRTSQFRLTLDAVFADAGVQRSKLIEVHSSEAASALVAAGGGVSVAMPFLPDMMANRRIRLVPFEPAIEVTLAVLLPARRAPSLTAEAFIDEMRTCVTGLWPQSQ